MENKPKFRIINKTNKTVTVKIGPESHTMSWDEYNKTFVTVDKFWAVFNEENQKIHEEAEEKISDAAATFLMARAVEGKDTSKYMTYMLMFGTYIDDIQKLLKCSMLEATQIIRKRLMVLNPFMTNPMFPVTNSQKKLRRKMEREAEEEVSKPVPVVDEKKPTLGDAFSCLGDLKAKMEKEGKVMDEDC
jgi:hypothetical protein